MKYGIRAAVLVALGALAWGLCYLEWIPMFAESLMAAYFLIFGPLSAFVTSILGLVKDKYKYLAVLTFLLSMAWIIFLCWMWFFLSPQLG